MAAVEFKKKGGGVQFPKKQIAPEDVRSASGVPGGVQPAGVNPVDTPEEFARMNKEAAQADLGEWLFSPFSGLANAAASTPYAIGKGSQWLANTLEDNFRELILGQPGAGRTIEQQNQRLAEQEQYLKSAADLSRGVRQNIFQPQTDIGQALETGGGFMLGGWPSKATRLALPFERATSYGADLVSNVALPAIGSEALGAATEGTPYETLARIVGAGAGAATGALSRGLGNPLESIVRRSTRNMTPDEWNAALTRSSNIRDTPIRATGPEIISDVTGGGSPLTNVQRYVEGDVIHGGRVMGPFMAARPGQFEEANQLILDSMNIPPSPRPTTLGAEAAEAATLAKGNAMEQRTAASAPDYAAANPQLMPEADVRRIVDAIDAEIAADTTGIKAHSLGELRRRLVTAPAQPAVPPAPTGILGPNGQPLMSAGTPAVPEQFALDIENLDRVRKYMRDTQDTIGTSTDPNRAAYEGEAGASLTRYLDQINQLMRRNSNSFAAAQDEFAANTRDIVDPIVKGPVGKVAQSGGDTRAAGEAIWPTNPLPGVAPEIATAVTALRTADPTGQRVDPQTIPQLFRNMWEDRFGTSMAPTQQQDRSFGGAKFYNRVAGTPEKGEVLNSILGALPQIGAGTIPLVTNVLDAMRTTGRRRPVGSATEFNKSLSDELVDPKISAAQLAMTGGANWFSKVSDWGNRLAKRRQIGALAELFTDPNSVERMQQMVARGPTTVIPEAIARTGLQGLNLLYGNPDQEPVR